MPELFREASATVADRRQGASWRSTWSAYTVSRDPRVTKIDLAQVGDAVSRVAIASTTGVDAEYARTDAWAVVVTLAVEGDETQTGFSYRDHPRRSTSSTWERDRRRGGRARGARCSAP